MKDGRASPPPLPSEFYYHWLATAINNVMNTHFDAEQIESMSEEQRLKYELWSIYGR